MKFSENNKLILKVVLILGMLEWTWNSSTQEDYHKFKPTLVSSSFQAKRGYMESVSPADFQTTIIYKSL